MNIFARAFHVVIGKKDCPIKIGSVLEGMFRIAYHFKHLIETRLYNDISLWQLENQPYDIFEAIEA